MKQSRRKAFNFFKSYFDVYNELNDKEKVQFMDALLNKQFFGEEPQSLTGMANFAYLSQKHNIDSQVKGFEDKTGFTLNANENSPKLGGAEGGSIQGKGKEEEKEKQRKASSSSERELKFLELFNDLKKKKGLKSNVRVLSKTDKSNLKQLNGHSIKDFKQAINTMLVNEWAKETGNRTPSHVLRVENFNRYLNQADTTESASEETIQERIERKSNELK